MRFPSEFKKNNEVNDQEMLADIMDCDSTTVKLHLKGAMNLLNIPNRSSLLANHLHMLDAIPDQVYEGR